MVMSTTVGIEQKDQALLLEDIFRPLTPMANGSPKGLGRS